MPDDVTGRRESPSDSPPPSDSRTTAPPRYETLDVWRGAACVSVVVFHSTFGYVVTPATKAETLANGGTALDWLAVATTFLWVGVPLFFVVSGYCIAASADAARLRRAPVGRFFARRFLRIYPPLWAFLLLAAAGLSLVPEYAMAGPHHGFDRPMPYAGELSWVNWVGAATLTEEWRHYFVGPPRAYLAGHMWTLCYEEQFYLIAGLLLWLLPRRFFLGVAVVSVAVLVCFCARPPVTGFFFDGQWLPFAAGVAVYYRAHRATAAGRRCLDVLLTAGAVAAVTYLPRRPELPDWLPTSMTVAAAFALLLGWLHRFDPAVTRIRALSPLRWCGVRCYSLYLIHGPVVVLLKWNLYRLGVTSVGGTLFVTVPACVAASALAAAAFHRWVESPCQGGRSRGGR